MCNSEKLLIGNNLVLCLHCSNWENHKIWPMNETIIHLPMHGCHRLMYFSIPASVLLLLHILDIFMYCDEILFLTSLKYSHFYKVLPDLSKLLKWYLIQEIL